MKDPELIESLRIADLISGYLNLRLSAAEEKELLEWIEESKLNKELFDKLVYENNLENLYAELQAFDTQKALARVRHRLNPNELHIQTPRKRWLIPAAASILLCVSIGLYFYQNRKQEPATIQIAKNEILPGGDKAILTLSDGKQISLTDAKSGILANQGNTAIQKTADGHVIYKAGQANMPKTVAEVIYNIISTPRAGKWTVTLPDNSIAWLDASSSIRFPATFTGKNRTVEITGQVYFEVKHDPSHPFNVKVKGQIIEDLGTKFNIIAFDDEPYLKTTLVEGSVRVNKEHESVLLKPGQQAITEPGKNTIRVKEADVEDAIAWKNGQTSFKDENIQSIMRQVSRWYDVEIEYQGNIPERLFTGGISRKSNLSNLLKILELNNIHFTVEGKKIIVRP